MYAWVGETNALTGLMCVTPLVRFVKCHREWQF